MECAPADANVYLCMHRRSYSARIAMHTFIQCTHRYAYVSVHASLFGALRARPKSSLRCLGAHAGSGSGSAQRTVLAPLRERALGYQCRSLPKVIGK